MIPDSDRIARAQDLIREGIPTKGGRWADLGSGSGVFTLALCGLLGPTGEIYSVDKDKSALSRQKRYFQESYPKAEIHYLNANFTRALDLSSLDGVVMANALHFIRKKEAPLALIRSYLKEGGRFILVEYNISRGNPWVPYPIDFSGFQRLATGLGYGEVRLLTLKSSRYHREMYSCLNIKTLPQKE